jgi:hypothetical protein
MARDPRIELGAATADRHRDSLAKEPGGASIRIQGIITSRSEFEHMLVLGPACTPDFINILMGVVLWFD